MSQENVEIVSDSFRAWLADDARWLDAIDPEIEWDFSRYPIPDLPPTGHGRDAFARLMAEFRASWTAYDNRIGEAIGAGDEVVVVYHETVQLRDSDTTLERDVSIVWTMREGRAVRYRAYPSRDAALEAVGLSE